MEQGEGFRTDGRVVGERCFGHFQLLRESLFSVFIDNIPGDKDTSWLRKLFDIAGKTMDVFIPRKERRATNSRFGFVRYKELEEAQEAISRWNGSVFGSGRLIVKLADFGGKPRNFLKGPERGQQRPALESLSRSNQFKEAGVVDIADVGFQLSSKKRTIPLEVIPELEEWLRNSAVAVLKAFIPCSQIEKELKLNGIKLHKIFPFGGKKVLIHFNAMNDLESCLSGHSCSLSKRFSSILKWKEEAPSRLRSVWLSIIGLPFKAWCEDNFQKIVEPLGLFLKVELRDFQESGLERVRVLVETKRMDRIFEVFDAEVGGLVVECVICEESFFNGRETDWKVEESSDKGEEAAAFSSSSEGQSHKGQQQGVVMQDGDRDKVSVQGGDRERGSDGESCRLDSSVAKSAPPGLETLGTLETSHSTPESPSGLEETCVLPLVRPLGGVKDLGKLISSSEASESSWDTTLFSFLKRKGKGVEGKKVYGQLGVGSSPPRPGEEGRGFVSAPVDCEDMNPPALVEDAIVDVSSEDGVSSRRSNSLKDASKWLANQYLSSAREFGDSAQRSSKAVRRKVSKGKTALKVQRKKERTELDRLKFSYLVELEKSNKCIKMPEAVSQSALGRAGSAVEERDFLQRKEVETIVKEDKRLLRRNSCVDAVADQPSEEGPGLVLKSSVEVLEDEDEERRKLNQRKAAEESLRVVRRVGMKFLGTEEEGIQFFINHDENRRKERGRPSSAV